MPSPGFAHAAVLLVAPKILLITSEILLITSGVLLIAGCASRGNENISPKAQACVQQAGPPVRASNYNQRLAALTLRANTFSECMTKYGFVLDEAKLQEKVLHEEWVRNSDIVGSDPMHDLWLLEQELRASPALWR